MNKINQTIKFAEKNVINIIPLDKGKKTPSINWLKYQKEVLSLEKIKKFFNEDVKYNIAFVCGKISDNLVVLDFDSEKVFKLFYPNYKQLEKDTTIVKTAHGVHLYFKTEKPLDYMQIVDENGNEIMSMRGEGHYVVAPPSIHPNGTQYTFISDNKIKRLKDIDLKQELTEKAEKIGYKIKGNKEIIKIEDLLKGCSKGARDNNLLRLISLIRKMGKTEEEALKICIKWNKQCNPPLNKRDIEYKVRYHYTRPEPYNYNYGKNISKIDISSDLKIIRKRENKKNNEKFDIKKYFNKSSFLACDLARDLCYDESGNSNGKYIVISDNQEIWYYNGGYYEPDGDRFIRAEVQKNIGGRCTPTMKNNVLSCVRDDNGIWIDRTKLNKNKHLINCKNGIYNLKTEEFIEHSPKYYFTYEIPINYNPDADCPKIKKFLGEILNPEDISIIQELIGYCLYPSYFIHKGFIFIGDGANGKSTLLRITTKLLGKNNISSVPLQTLGKDKFAAHDLHGNLANICADIPNAALRNTGLFKMITGEDFIRGERKFKDAYGFTNHAKLIFSANQLPAAPVDQSDAFFRRWIPINFPNRFTGAKCDKNIFTKITTEEEMSGLLNWSLKGLKRLLDNQDFSYKKSIDETRDYWNRASDKITEFREEYLIEDSEGNLTKEEVYTKFKQFCIKKKYPTVASNVFSRRFKEAINFKIEEGQQRKDRKKTWKGISWKNEEEQQQQDLSDYTKV